MWERRPGHGYSLELQCLTILGAKATRARSAALLDVTFAITQVNRPEVSVSSREPRTTHYPPQKTFLIGWYFWRGWCANCRNLRRRQNTHHPQFCTHDVVDFVGVVRGFRGLIFCIETWWPLSSPTFLSRSFLISCLT